jgi:YVTN family beta-propeller protein
LNKTTDVSEHYISQYIYFCMFLFFVIVFSFNAAAGLTPSSIAIDTVTKKIYEANSNINTVSVINPSSINMKTIRVGILPTNVAVNEVTHKIYVSNSGSNTVSVIDGLNDTKIADVEVGEGPYSLFTSSYGSYDTYGTNLDSGTISVINGMNNSKIKDFPAGEFPYLMF